jgi:antitoxin YefM
MKRNKHKGLKETAYLLRSPKNAERLLAALREAKMGKGSAESIESLRLSVGLGKK